MVGIIFRPWITSESYYYGFKNYFKLCIHVYTSQWGHNSITLRLMSERVYLWGMILSAKTDFFPYNKQRSLVHFHFISFRSDCSIFFSARVSSTHEYSYRKREGSSIIIYRKYHAAIIWLVWSVISDSSLNELKETHRLESKRYGFSSYGNICFHIHWE